MTRARVGILGDQFPLHRFAGVGKKLQQMRPGNFRPLPDGRGESFVAGGAQHQRRIAEFRECRAGIAGGAQRDLAVAAFHQHVGHGLGQHFAPGNGEQMRLALGSRSLHQRRLVDPFGMGEDGARNIDRVVERQAAHDPGRRVGHAGEEMAEARARRRFDLAQQPRHHVVEQRDLVIGQMAGRADEQVGHPTQRDGAVADLLAAERAFEVIDQ